MWRESIISVFQSLSVVVLGLIGLLEITKHPKEGLNRLGKVLLILFALIYVCTTFILARLSTASQEQLKVQIESLQTVLLDQVMNAPHEIGSLAPEKKLTTDLDISVPVSGEVGWRPDVEGRVTDPKAEVWVVVHPVGLSSYWIQSPVTVRKDGKWQVSVYIGRAGDIDIGKKFEIMAIAYPRKMLTEGQVLSEWPKAKWRSDIIIVVRK
jgi:hypothetical protein